MICQRITIPQQPDTEARREKTQLALRVASRKRWMRKRRALRLQAAVLGRKGMLPPVISAPLRWSKSAWPRTASPVAERP